ncbi:MAG: hypothetical protein AMJ55_09760 [Gammaproteobacteria bacterium SG8_15]|nr:MAG: hypothetical protein AMJ55_09760 [Gammaproteobacteria bacterium SG8_15]
MTSAANCALLRADLIINPRYTGGQKIFVVKDPVNNTFFQFKEYEYFITQQLDGNTPLEQIKRAFEERFEADIDTDTLNGFIESLRIRRLLADGSTSASPAINSRIIGQGLTWRFHLYNPDNKLEFLHQYARFAFTTAFLRTAIALFVTGIILFLTNFEWIQHETSQLISTGMMPLFLLVLFIIVTCHEFSHGLACKHFGGKVREMGFLLLYFIPAFYCNVSDSWLFEKKRHRIIVTFAGVYFELFIWSLAIITWRLTEPGTAPSILSLLIMMATGIRTLFNLTPFIKLDGYYILSDLLEIHNLRGRALKYFKARLLSILGYKTKYESVSKRESTILLWYGLLGLLFTIGLIGFLLYLLGFFLLEQFQGSGFIVFTLLLSIIFWNFFKRIGKRMLDMFRKISINDFKNLKRWKFPIIVGSMLLASFFIEIQLTVSGEFRVLPKHNADIRAQVEGLITSIHVTEGQSVNRDQLLVELDDREFRAQLADVQALLKEKQANLKLLLAGTRAEEIEFAKVELEKAKTQYEFALQQNSDAKKIYSEELKKAHTNLEKAKERLNYANNELATHKKFLAQNYISKKQVEEAEQEVVIRRKEFEEAQTEVKLIKARGLGRMKEEHALVQKEVEKAENKLQMLLAGTRPEALEAAQAEVESLASRKNYLLVLIEQLKIKSPIDGIVTTPNLSEKQGVLVEKGDLIMEVYDFGKVKAEMLISEKDIGVISMGQSVALKARAYSQDLFSGQVTLIAPTVSLEKDIANRKHIRVLSLIDNPNLLLKPEMTGHAKVYCGSISIFELATRRIMQYFRVEFWSWW